MSHREVRERVAELEPRPDVAPTVRKLPERPAPACESPLLGIEAGSKPRELGAPRVESDAVSLEYKVAAPARPAFVEPLAPARYQVGFTASEELREKLECLQALMRSAVPDGDLARIIDIAVSEKLRRVEAKRFGQTKAPRRDADDIDTLFSLAADNRPDRGVVVGALRAANGRSCLSCRASAHTPNRTVYG